MTAHGAALIPHRLKTKPAPPISKMLTIIAGEVKSNAGIGSVMKRRIPGSKKTATMVTTIVNATPAEIISVGPNSASRLPGDTHVPISRNGAAMQANTATIAQGETPIPAGMRPTMATVARIHPPMTNRMALQPRLTRLQSPERP